jgi:AraC-like DNA-binding protein
MTAIHHVQLISLEQDQRSLPRWSPAISLPARTRADRGVLLWQVEGSADCDLEGESVRIPARHALWVPAGITHRVEVHADSVLFPVHVRVDTVVGALSTPRCIAVDADLQTRLLALFQSQTTIIKHPHSLDRAVLGMLTERIVPHCGLPLPCTAAARAIAEHFRDHPSDSTPLSDLARAQHVSTRTVERAFVAETGRTAREWRLERRMDLAAALLRRIVSPPVVAARVGYQSYSAFRRAFKAAYGQTPTDYARRFAVEA